MRDEPEFAEHKRLVDQAVAFLMRYEDSTSAVRGIRLLSSLLEGAAKQQPSKHHARHDEENKAGPHEGNPLAWPLEYRQSIDARGLTDNPAVRVTALSRCSHLQSLCNKNPN